MYRRILLATAALSPLAFHGIVQADYPDRPIRIFVAFAPGGPGDLLARTMANAISPVLKQPVIVESRPGAGGLVGVQALANAVPDGYSLYMGVFPNVSPVLIKTC